MLQFKHNTKVHRLENRGSKIPKFSFNFCPFDKLPQHNNYKKPLQDIIGVISHVGPFDYASPTSPNNTIINIRNLEEETLQIRLWGQHGETFDEESAVQKSKEGNAVGVFTGVTAAEFSGIVHASSTSTTKIYINLDTDEVKNYQTRYQWQTPPLQQQQPQVVCLSPIQAAGKLYTLDQISNMPTPPDQDGATYCAIAKVKSIITSAKWYYKGCKHCDKGYNTISDTPKCLCTNYFPKPMYKLPLSLMDDSGALDAIAFSNAAEQLVELNAYQASQNMKIDLEEHVGTLDKAIGKTRLFHISKKAIHHPSFLSTLHKLYPLQRHLQAKS